MDLEMLEKDLWDVIGCIYCDERTDALKIITEILEQISVEK